ncbi:hypothetical protein CPB86DRAFT_696894 [Serendipita vermifera]|nr:hypothetical protein CPB86DRAFT_696894 [Serendipita vermifera]
MTSATIYATKSRHVRFLLIAAVLSSAVYILLWFSTPLNNPRAQPRSLNKTKSSLAWGVATRLFVISLARRTDRRVALAPLLEAHGLTQHQDFEFIDATDVTNAAVSQIVSHVQAQRRKEFEFAKAWKGRPSQPNSFREVVENSASVPWGSDLWTTDAPPTSEYWSGMNWLGELDPDSDYPILIEKGNPFNPHKFDAYLYRQTEGVAYLTRGMVACWHSHVTLIRNIALLETEIHASNISEPIGDAKVSAIPERPVYIVLEDDVDFEWDIDERLTGLWAHLPGDWEIAMLGHCWSDESRYPPIARYPVDNTATTRLHPSNSPLCTHAYALTTQGAKRLYSLLRHPAFAYSRPLDQAIAWLIRNRHLNQAYSFVPSLIVQTKTGNSDISMRRKGSRWKDSLYDSTLSRVKGT